MKLKRKKIFLVGMMGVGKTTFGKKLAQELGYDFVDTDAEIKAKQGQSIKEIFEQRGEGFFRELEVELANELKDNLQPQIVSTGGGFPCNNDVMRDLMEIGICVYIKATPKFISSRIYKENSERPLVIASTTKVQLEQRLEKILEKRAIIYERAHITFDALDLKSRSIKSIIETIRE